MIDLAHKEPAAASFGPSASIPPAQAPEVAGAQGDLFALGRAAAAAARQISRGKGIFCRSRQLLATGAWRGPRDAAEAYVEEEDLPALGGLGAARAAGVRTVAATTATLAREAAAAGLRVLWRLPYRADEPALVRSARLTESASLARAGVALDGVVPTPVGEPMGLDTLRLVATCRLQLPVPHVVADFVKLGHRLAQMSLAFGADELFGPIAPERALRLGANAHDPVMTRKEAATLLRGAGLTPHERLAGGALEAFAP
jgi:hypothetical protein